MKNGNHKQALKNALSGIFLSLKTERNLRLMVLIAVLVIAVSFWLRLSLMEFAIIIWAIFAVISVEMINTSLESITDLVREEWHQKAKKAKDIASGMVLIAVIGAAVIGGLIFIPKFMDLFLSF